MELTWEKNLPSDLLERWPKAPSGEPEKAVFLCNIKAVDLADELKINMLEAYGIPCLRDYPGNGSFGKVVLGMSGQGTDIYVPESRLEEARNLCTAEPEEEEQYNDGYLAIPEEWVDGECFLLRAFGDSMRGAGVDLEKPEPVAAALDYFGTIVDRLEKLC